MMIVEQYFQWAEPIERGNLLEIERVGEEFRIMGLLPGYEGDAQAFDLMCQYARAAKYRPVGAARSGEESPEIMFANADSDEKLIAFVRRFGPVVAKIAFTNFDKPEEGLLEPRWPVRLSAIQDMQELRNEHLIYRCALTLLSYSSEPKYDYLEGQRLIADIAAKIIDWPMQWEREKILRRGEPFWKLTQKSLERIDNTKSSPLGVLMPANFNARLVLCDLTNAFRPTLFPSPSHMHASIKYGIRPLLYSILRRQLLNPRDLSACANSQCRNFFHIERGGQRFCSEDCSQHQRQRTYWAKRGKKLRKKRTKQHRKANQ
jgi:hypothetical protein